MILALENRHGEPDRVSVLDWNRDAADAYAEMRVEREAKGKPIGNMDLLIAAHARSLRAVLVPPVV